jgi:hypothetical protein
LQKLINNQPPYAVSEIAKAYGANGLSATGTGQKIGIVIDTFPADSDLTLFWQGNAVGQSPEQYRKSPGGQRDAAESLGRGNP